ncbi:hypothetical protein CALVIDRAFT_598714, partial [Calocera viscosa TUFC12733]
CQPTQVSPLLDPLHSTPLSLPRPFASFSPCSVSDTATRFPFSFQFSSPFPFSVRALLPRLYTDRVLTALASFGYLLIARLFHISS